MGASLVGGDGWQAAVPSMEQPTVLTTMTIVVVLILVMLIVVHVQRRRGSVGAGSAVSAEPAMVEPYPGYFQRHGRTAMMSSAKRGCRGLSSRDLGNDGVVIIDVNNVRGKFGFRRADTIAFCGCVTRWASVNGLAGQVLLAVDHGPRPAVISVADTMFCFAGPRLEADDTIVFDIDWFLRNGRVPVVVVTADRDLKRRCRAAFNAHLARQTDAVESDHLTLRIIDSGAFAGWISRSGWPEYQTNCCIDGLCSCAAFGGANGVASTPSAHNRRQISQRSGGAPERTADRMKLAHHAFNVVRSVSAKKSQLGCVKAAMRWHDGYAAWVTGGRK